MCGNIIEDAKTDPNKEPKAVKKGSGFTAAYVDMKAKAYELEVMKFEHEKAKPFESQLDIEKEKSKALLRNTFLQARI